jgi:glutathione S-transferase
MVAPAYGAAAERKIAIGDAILARRFWGAGDRLPFAAFIFSLLFIDLYQ